MDRVVEKYIKNIEIQTTLNSRIIKFSLKEYNVDKAEHIINKLIEKYNDDVVSDKEEIIKITSDFISSRLEVVAQELEQVDLTAENMKQANRLSDLGSQSSIFSAKRKRKMKQN